MKPSLLRIFLIIVLYSSQFLAQNKDAVKIDSLKLEINSQGSNHLIVVDSYLELSKIFLKTSVDSSKFYAAKGFNLAVKVDYAKGLAVAYIRKCKINDIDQNMDLAIDYGTKAIELYEGLIKDSDYLFILNLMGYLHERQTNFDTALELYLEGLRSSKAQGDDMYQGFFYNNISAVYSKTGHLDDSIEYCHKAISIYKKLGLKKYYGGGLANLGSFYIDKNEFQKARTYLKEANVIALELQNYYTLEKIELNLGIIEEEEENHEAALNHFIQAKNYVEKLPELNEFRIRSLAFLEEKLGHTYKELKQYKLAIKSYQTAIIYGEKNQSNDLLNHSYYDLFLIYNELQKADSANYYIQKYLPINDSIKEATLNKKIEDLNYKSKLEDEKIKHQHEKNLILVKQKKNQFKYLLVISFLGLVVISILFLWNIKKNKLIKSELRRKNLTLETEKLNSELERSNKELSTSILNLIERNQFIASISEKLEQIKSIDHADDKKRVQSILREIDRNTTKKLWKEFELCYVEVHKDFFVSLNNQYPQLTSNDRKLCALTILNLSIKEICSITYQSEQSVKMARYRLRKKLGVNKNENLNSFLNNI